jgi:hypothetical protein
MSIDQPPERRRCQNGGTRLGRPVSSIANENDGSCPRFRLETDHEPPGYGTTAAVLYPASPGAIQECSYPRFTRLLVGQLIF